MELKNFNALKKNLKRDVAGYPRAKLAVLGECATQMATTAIRGSAIERGWDFEVFEADYDQVHPLLLNPRSEVYAFAPDFIVVFTSSRRLAKAFYGTPEAERGGFAERHVEQLREIARTVAESSRAKLIVANYPELDDAVFGNFANKVSTSLRYQLRKVNLLLMEAAQVESGLFVLDLCSLQAAHGSAFLEDPKLYVSADMVHGLEALPLVAKHVVDIVLSALGRVTKCVVLDLDNTLWGGVVGDDGWENLELGELGLGKAFTDLQKWIRELKQRGIILAVCSKNDEAVAKTPFEKHPDMVLRLDDIAVFVANWENKVDNIRHIQSVLNIGFDSMVFLDDNPFERNMVRSAIPEIAVPELPADPAEYLAYLARENLFETASYASSDADRTRQYRAEAERAKIAKSYGDEDEYLRSLEMVGEVQPFTDFNVPRVAQLTQRSNQFNLRTVRYTESDVRAIAQAKDKHGLAFTLRDKLGDHGLISVVILAARAPGELFVDTWLMSCRVLKRDVEHFVLDAIVERTRAEGAGRVVGEYIPTAKNGMVKEHYAGLGFRPEGGLWVLDVADYAKRRCFISRAE
jgi:FkbH-like protein